MEPIVRTECPKCSSTLLPSNICYKCTQESSAAPRRILRLSKNTQPAAAGLPVPDKSDKPPTKSTREFQENKSPPRITERNFRIFHGDYDSVTEDESSQPKSTKRSLKLQLLSSSTTDQCLYQSGSFSSADTVIEEQWTESTMTSISLLRITNDTFDNPPFLGSSYGKDVTKLSFEGPCTPKAILMALEYFTAVHTLEFASGFFIHEDFDPEELETFPVPRMEFSRIKSLSVNYDSERHDKMNEAEQKQMHLRIISLLNFFSGGLKALDYCNLSVPDASELDDNLNSFITANGSRKGITDYANNQIRYTTDLSSSSQESHSNSPTKVANNNRKRKADSPPPPEVEITKMVSKEDKIEDVTLTLSSSDDDQESSEANNEINTDDVTLLTTTYLLLARKIYRHEVINRLSQPSWREAHKGKWGSFHCTSIRVGDYECTGAGSGGGGKRNNEVRTMIFSKFGIYFRSPHFTVKKRKPLRIGIPIEDITGVKIYDPNPNSFNATIYVKTDENSAAWIRKLLGMSRSEESQGFYSPRSKYHCHRFIEFQTGSTPQENLDLFMLMYRSKLDNRLT